MSKEQPLLKRDVKKTLEDKLSKKIQREIPNLIRGDYDTSGEMSSRGGKQEGDESE